MTDSSVDKTARHSIDEIWKKLDTQSADTHSIAMSLAKIDGKIDLLAKDVEHVREAGEKRAASTANVRERVSKIEKRTYFLSGVAAATGALIARMWEKFF